MEIREAKFLRAVTQADQAPRPERPAVVFAGRSNSGKSSLINTLAKRKGLAKTSSTPGRTREIVFFEVNGKYHFVDLPGYGYADVPERVRAQWGPMVERFLGQSPSIRLAVIILDVRRDPNRDDKQLIDWLESLGLPYVFAVTKTDKVGRGELARRLKAIQAALGLPDGDALVPFSAETGAGRRELLRVLAEALNAPPIERPSDPPESSAKMDGN